MKFLTGNEFDKSSKLWQDFKEAKSLRDYWIHPKPPFDTNSLKLYQVKKSIITVRAVIEEVSSMMGLKPAPWMQPFEEIYAIYKN